MLTKDELPECGNYSSVNWKQMEAADHAKSPFKTMEIQ